VATVRSRVLVQPAFTQLFFVNAVVIRMDPAKYGHRLSLVEPADFRKLAF
jgi:hypothetical protein